ncbi:hypothetical protein BTZ20_3637 [Rhodococcus sp. MTM3W5.2]|nr:hypothetical protein BTZ20_3637 [Rhodococcus sp. MTM3W5.2]
MRHRRRSRIFFGAPVCDGNADGEGCPRRHIRDRPGLRGGWRMASTQARADSYRHA